MDSKRQRIIVFLLVPALVFGELMVDLRTPLGISDWVWYFIPLLLTIYAGGRLLPYLLAGIFSVTMLVGWRFSPPGTDPGLALIGRGMGIGVMWLMALFISQHKGAEARLRRTERALRAISTCNQAMIRAGSEPALLREVCRVIVEEGGYRLAWVGLAEQDEQKTVRPVAHAGYDAGYLDRVKITWSDTERGRGPTGTAIRTKQPAICRRMQTDPSYLPWRAEAIARGYHSSLVLPLLKGEEVLGALNIYSVASGAFDDAEVKMLTELADDLAYGIVVLRTRIERQQAEEHVEEQARLLDLAHDAIVVSDMEDHIRYWNQGAERIYGWTAREAIGRKVNDLLPKDKFNTLKSEEARKTILETGNWQGELATRTKGGGEVFVETRWTLVRDAQGAPRSVLGISTDITERKKFETQFLRAQRMESIGTLASGIAHDLNNVLTPLLISVQVLEERIADADGKELLATLEAGVRRGASLVKQVLTFGRGAEGERVPIHPETIAREVKQIIHETFPKSVGFELHCPADLWTMTGDATQLHQVLLNLCVNARDAMPNGGKLSIQMENAMVDEAGVGLNLEARPGSYVAISVADTGTGIPKEIQDKIFDPFYTTKEPGKGTGLGLFTTQAIIKSHDGFIVCQSDTGKGTTFKMYFPANRAPAEAENASAADSRLPRGHKELVLVVDDEEPILNLVQKVLKRHGYRVLLARNGVEAVSLYRRRQKEIDLLLTDMVMPVMDGPATIIALKHINSKLKIIGSSGLADESGLARARDAGVRHFIPKPYTAETLLVKVHEVLQEKSPVH